jgi:acyl transferase domain-containing protein
MHDCRLVLTITHETDLNKLIANTRQMLQQKTRGHWNLPDGAWFGSGKADGKLALLFPGQGAQYPDMLLDLACQFPAMQDTLYTSDEELGTVNGGQHLSRLIYPIPVFTDEARHQDAETLHDDSKAPENCTHEA